MRHTPALRQGDYEPFNPVIESHSMRHLPALSLLLLFVTSCQSSPDVPAIRESAPVTSYEEVPYPPPVISLERFEDRARTSGEIDRAPIFRVTNVAVQSIYYYGYEHIPFVSIAQSIGGKWISDGPLYCGTGAGRHEIKPGASEEVRVHMYQPKSAVFRVGIGFSLDPNHGTGSYVWSEVLDASRN